MVKGKKVKEDAEEVTEGAATPSGSELDVEVSKPNKPSASGSVTFTLKSRNHAGGVTHRVFSSDEHGEDYASLADQFEKANQSEILKRE